MTSLPSRSARSDRPAPDVPEAATTTTSSAATRPAPTTGARARVAAVAQQPGTATRVALPTVRPRSVCPQISLSSSPPAYPRAPTTATRICIDLPTPTPNPEPDPSDPATRNRSHYYASRCLSMQTAPVWRHGRWLGLCSAGRLISGQTGGFGLRTDGTRRHDVVPGRRHYAPPPIVRPGPPSGSRADRQVALARRAGHGGPPRGRAPRP